MLFAKQSLTLSVFPFFNGATARQLVMSNKDAKGINRGGRPGSSVWDHITKAGQKDGTVIFTCNHCNKEWVMRKPQATKFAKHLLTCEDCPLEHRKIIARSSNAKEIREIAKRENLLTDPTPIVAPVATLPNPLRPTPSVDLFDPNKKRKAEPRQQSIQHFVDHCDNQRAQLINESIMAFLAGCAIPFLIVESVFFIRMIRSLNKTHAEKHLPRNQAFIRNWLPRLHKSVESRLGTIWQQQGSHFRTLGTDGFTTETGQMVTIVTESLGPMCAFNDCVPKGEDTADASHFANLWEVKLLAMAGNDPSKVESVCAAVVGDNTKCNPEAGKILRKKFPKVFFNGCRTHCADLLVEDIARIVEFDEIMTDVKVTVRFVNNHEKVKAAHQRKCTELKAGTTLKNFAQTRFAHSALMLESLIGRERCNTKALQALREEPSFEHITCKGISANLKEKLKSLMGNQ